MSIWIRAFTEKSVEGIDGIEWGSRVHKRILLLSLLYDVEEDISDLKVETSLKSDGRIDKATFSFAGDLLVARIWSGERAKEEISELLEASGVVPASVPDRLNKCQYVAGFQLSITQSHRVAWAVSIAAAAALVERFGGVIQADESGWMIPTEREVDYLE